MELAYPAQIGAPINLLEDIRVLEPDSTNIYMTSELVYIFGDIETLTNLELSRRISSLFNALNYNDTEKQEIIEHKFSSEIIFKDILRTGVGALLSGILGQLGFANYSLVDLAVDLSRNKSEWAKRIFSVLFYILSNWNELLQTEIDSFEVRLVKEVARNLKDNLQQNMATLLGENVNWSEEIINTLELSHSKAAKLKGLVDKNGLRQIQFRSDYGKSTYLEFLLPTTIRAFDITRGERELIEMANELIKFLLRWGSYIPDQDRIMLLNRIKQLVGRDEKLLSTVEKLENMQLNIGDMIVEVSPPIYVTQKNMMVRVFTMTENGYSVNIFHIPNTPDNGMQLKRRLAGFQGAEEITTYSNPNDSGNLALSSLTLIPAGNTVTEIKALLPFVLEYEELVDINDQLVQQNISNAVYADSVSVFIESLISQTMDGIDDPLTMRDIARRYDGYIRAVFIGTENTRVDGLNKESKQRVAEATRNAVINGSGFETALSTSTRNETSNSVSYKTDSDGPCVTIDHQITINNPASNNQKFDQPMLLPERIGETTQNVMTKGEISIQIETKRTEKGLRTVMSCPVCHKGRFELVAECDAPKDYRCPICKNDILEMRKWWENGDEGSFTRKINVARKKYDAMANQRIRHVHAHESPETHPNWADHLITFLTFGLIQPVSSSEAIEQ